MQFHEIENEWCPYKGVWMEGDVDLYDMTLMVDEYSDDECAYLFEYWDWSDSRNSWYSHISVHASGTPGAVTLHITIDGEHVGYVDVSGGNEWENVLLGIYDAIEAWFNDMKLFGVSR